VSPYVLYNTENLIKKYTNKCICFYNLLMSAPMGLQKKNDYLRGHGKEKVKNYWFRVSWVVSSTNLHLLVY